MRSLAAASRAAASGGGEAEPFLQAGCTEDGEDRDQHAPAGEDQPELDGGQAHRERRIPGSRELVSDRE